MNRKFALSLILYAAMSNATAVALTPPAACLFDSQLGRFLEEGEVERASTQSVLPDTFQSGIAVFEVRDLKGRRDGSKWLVLQHCPSSKDLMVEIGANESAVRARFNEMVFGSGRHTMNDLAAELSRLGARTEIGTRRVGNCACFHQQFFYGP